MYLKKIELQGFKSFADKTTLEFKPGITAVIGPNGSGKSNVADAIRWVLGEQSIKTLRGSKLEDVIFSGTQARKSLGFAEVDITIDNIDGKLPIDYAEVTITRRVYRSGESEFFINKNQCRLKDIVELFMDTGIGRDGYSIIGQGRIDEILSTKSEERRRIFEEAAGIVKYRTRKEEAEKKLDNTKQNLIRINDIVSEIASQLEPLKAQSEKARKFLDLRENLKYLEVGLFINNIEKNRVKLEEVNVQIKEFEDQCSNEENKLYNMQELKEKTRILLDELINEVENIQTNSFESQNSIEKYKADIGIYNEKIQHNLENFNKFEKEIEEFKNRECELENEKADRQVRKERLSSDKQKFETELKEKETKLKLLTDKLTDEQKNIEEIKNKIMQNIDIKFEKMEVLNELGAVLESNTARVSQIEKENSDNIHEIDKERMKKEDEALELNRVTKERNSLKEKIDLLSKTKLEYNNKVQNFEENIRKSLDEIRMKESKYKFLNEMEREFEGYNRAVKEVLKNCSKDKSFGINIHGALASLIKVPSDYEVAIEMALGAMLQNIVTETEEDAKRAIEYLKHNNFGRATFLPITALKANKIDEKLKDTDGFIGIASELIEYDKKYEQIIQNLLGRTIIVNKTEDAIKIAKKFKYGFKIVTLDGDIINPSGQMSGGSILAKTTSILSRGREISQLEKQIKELKKQYEKELNSLEKYKKETEASLLEFEDLDHKLQEISILFATETEKMSNIENNIDRMSKRISLLDSEKEQLLIKIEETKKDIQSINELINKLENQNEEMQIVVNEFIEKNSEKQSTIDFLNEDIVNLRISVSSFDESSLSIDELVSRIEQDIQNCKDNIQKRIANKDKILKENENMKNLINSAEEEIFKIGISIKTLDEKINELKKNREEKNFEIIELERGIEEQFKTIDILRNQISKQDVKKSKLELDIETIQNKMWEEYETTPNTAQNYATVTNTTAKEVEGCKEEIKSLGNININAIEEYKTIKERYEFLIVQKNDLEESEKSLNKIIADMIDLMKIQFAKQFELINQNFGEVFTELFGGGRAELRLADDSDILQSGIEIEVQPPGKKLQNMMLLSGGERALTAIALLFAILKLSPSPFCILDEIEAALDEVNVYRFTDYLKKFSSKTQFLVITHRKGTMEGANTVYGVTMQEHGVSKLISMQLG